MSAHPRLPADAEARQSSCDGKHTFTSMQLARQVAQRSRNSKDCNAQPYRCPACNHFHIGTHLRKNYK